jgi:hypothetical protein
MIVQLPIICCFFFFFLTKKHVLLSLHKAMRQYRDRMRGTRHSYIQSQKQIWQSSCLNNTQILHEHPLKLHTTNKFNKYLCTTKTLWNTQTTREYTISTENTQHKVEPPSGRNSVAGETARGGHAPSLELSLHNRPPEDTGRHQTQPEKRNVAHTHGPRRKPPWRVQATRRAWRTNTAEVGGDITGRRLGSQWRGACRLEPGSKT